MKSYVERCDLVVKQLRVVPVDTSHRTVAEALFEDCDEIVDFVIRMLAQQDQHPALSIWHNTGRAFFGNHADRCAHLRHAHTSSR